MAVCAGRQGAPTGQGPRPLGKGVLQGIRSRPLGKRGVLQGVRSRPLGKGVLLGVRSCPLGKRGGCWASGSSHPGERTGMSTS